MKTEDYYRQILVTYIQNVKRFFCESAINFAKFLEESIKTKKPVTNYNGYDVEEYRQRIHRMSESSIELERKFGTYEGFLQEGGAQLVSRLTDLSISEPTNLQQFMDYHDRFYDFFKVKVPGIDGVSKYEDFCHLYDTFVYLESLGDYYDQNINSDIQSLLLFVKPTHN